MSENVTFDRELTIVVNEDGDITADADRDAAVARMHDEYGGDTFRILKLSVKVPRPRDYLASITLPEEGGETVNVQVVDNPPGP